MLDLGEARKVALFGGTYNNWLALEATVAHARAQGVDELVFLGDAGGCLLYTSPSPRDQRGSRMPSSA